MPGFDLISLLVYIALLRGFTLYNWRVRTVAAGVAILPLLLYGLIAIVYHLVELPHMAPPLLPRLAAAPFQFFVTAAILALMQRYEDTLGKWFALAIAGAVINYLAIPLLIQRFLPL